jgi:hypothetical protein
MLRTQPGTSGRTGQQDAIAPRQDAPRLLLQINGSSSKPVILRLKDRIVLGCGGADWDIDVDLRPFHGVAFGVSRHHAALQYDGAALWVTDLDSIHGTRINGAPLVSGRTVRLRSGDELMLGQLPVVVRLLRP